MDHQFIRIRNRLINVAAISYVRYYDDLDRLDIRLLGPPTDVGLTIALQGEEAEPVRRYFEDNGNVKDLRPATAESPTLGL